MYKVFVQGDEKFPLDGVNIGEKLRRYFLANCEQRSITTVRRILVNIIPRARICGIKTCRSIFISLYRTLLQARKKKKVRICMSARFVFLMSRYEKYNGLLIREVLFHHQNYFSSAILLHSSNNEGHYYNRFLCLRYSFREPMNSL